jgi:hypothetical protein
VHNNRIPSCAAADKTPFPVLVIVIIVVFVTFFAGFAAWMWPEIRRWSQCLPIFRARQPDLPGDIENIPPPDYESGGEGAGGEVEQYELDSIHSSHHSSPPSYESGGGGAGEGAGTGGEVEQHELDSIHSSHHSPVPPAGVHGDTIDENPDFLENVKFVLFALTFSSFELTGLTWGARTRSEGLEATNAAAALPDGHDHVNGSGDEPEPEHNDEDNVVGYVVDEPEPEHNG